MEVLWNGDGVQRWKGIGPVEVLWDKDGVHPPGGGQSENITSRRTTYYETLICVVCVVSLNIWIIMACAEIEFFTNTQN